MRILTTHAHSASRRTDEQTNKGAEMASEHNKRKKSEDEDGTVKIIYHTCPKYVECICGEIIKYVPTIYVQQIYKGEKKSKNQ